MRLGGGFGFFGLPDFQLAVHAVHRNGGAGGDGTFQQLLAQHGLHGMLDIPTQRTGTEFGVIGLVNDEGLRRVRQDAGNLPDGY